MTPLPSEMKDQLQQDYVSTFDRKMNDLEAAFAAKDPKKMREIFHKLVGTGKTYEMEDISRISRVCEQVLATSFPEEQMRKALDHLRVIFEQRKLQVFPKAG